MRWRESKYFLQSWVQNFQNFSRYNFIWIIIIYSQFKMGLGQSIYESRKLKQLDFAIVKILIVMMTTVTMSVSAHGPSFLER